MEMWQAPQVLTADDVFDLIREDLCGVEEAIGIESAASFDTMVPISRHLQPNDGERFRATVLLLCARLAGGGGGGTAIQLGAVVEMLHAASLLHDDVIDAQQTPSANVHWMNTTSVLGGDLLYARAFRIALQEQVLDLAINAAQMMAMGELIQLNRTGRIAITEGDCMEVVDLRTASLFSACGKMGAVAGGTDPEDREKLGEFAWNLGMAFKLIDDLRDLARHSTHDKPAGEGLRGGRVTLPLVYALEQASGSERNLVAAVLRDRSYEAVPFASVLAVVVRYGGIQRTRARAQQFTDRAREIMAEFPDGVCRRALFTLTDLVTERAC